MEIRKRLAAAWLLAGMVMLTACGQESSAPTATAAAPATRLPTQTAAAPPADTPTAEPSETVTPVPTPTPIPSATPERDTPTPTEETPPAAEETRPGPPWSIPQGSIRVLDGLLEADEWAGALVDLLPNGDRVLVMRDKRYLYLGVHTHGSVVGSICVAHGDQVSVLHSSLALGKAVYRREGGTWRLSEGFDWEPWETMPGGNTLERLGNYLEGEGWAANTGYMGDGEALEYQIAIPDEGFRFAVAYLLFGEDVAGEQILSWPREAKDGCANAELITSAAPRSLAFSPGNWVEVLPSPAE
jgi:hypothetical protein